MFTRKQKPGAGRLGRFKPQLEALEDRCCPSSVSFQNHVLHLVGNAASDTIVVRDNGNGGISATITDGNGHKLTISETGVDKILIDSTSEDHIDYALTSKLIRSETLQLNLPRGDDQVRLDFSDGVAAHGLNININGGGGDQNVAAVFGAVDGTDLQLAANLGNGWDHFLGQFNGDLSGKAKVDLNVQGGDGDDGVTVAARGAIGAQAQLNISAHGNGDDTVHVDYAGKLYGSLSLQEQAGNGWDWLESHINLTPGSTGSLIAHEVGGMGADLLMLMVQDQGSRLNDLDALISNINQDSSTVHTPNVKVLNAH